MNNNSFLDFLNEEIPPILVGRDQLISSMFREIANGQVRAYEMSAASYMGSSALLEFISSMDHLFGQKKTLFPKSLTPKNYCPIYLDAAMALDDIPAADWLLEGALKSENLADFAEKGKYSPSGQSIRDLRNLLKRSRSAGLKTVFLIDHFDQKFTSLKPEESMNLRGLTNFASFVIATRKPLAKLNQYAYGSWFGSVTKRIKLDAIDENAKRELIGWCLANANNLTQKQGKALVPLYSKAIRIVGMIPSFILTASAEFCTLRENLPQIPSEVVETVLKDRLNTVFQPRFSYYLRHLEKDNKTSLANLLADNLNEKDYSRLIDLQQLGLLTTEGGLNPRFKPFSPLFEHYLSIEAPIGKHKIIVNGQFSALHSRILDLMLEQPNQPIGYDIFLQQIWGKPVDDKNLRLLRETMRGLKKKMTGKIKGEIITHRGAGYELKIDFEENL